MIVGVFLVNLCLYGGMFLLANGVSATTSAPKLTTGQKLELRAAHAQALAVALSWQPDAELVGATTSWRLAGGDRLTLHRPAWSFSFYSPAARQVQVVTVNQQGAQAGPQQAVDMPPQRAGLDWHLDSDDLLLTFLSYGGQAFINAHPSANIHVQLKGEGIGRSTWYITAIDPVTRQSLLVGVDALSRQVVLNATDKGGG
jgi:hypothetical protein